MNMKMTPTLSLPLLLSLSLSLLIYTSNAFDITQILSQYPDFSSFKSYLTQTNLAAEINSRQTITVLVVDNAHIASLSAKPLDLIKNIISVHVILDFYDPPKLQQLADSSALVTTLFQATGFARGQQGFLNVTRSSGGIAFGSAMPGSPHDSNLVKSVVSQPYNISVLQVSSAIIPQGIDGSKVSSPPVKAPTDTPNAAATPPPTTSPPVSSQTAPPTAPTRSISVPVPSTAPPKPSAVPVPSTAPPTASSASVPSTAPPKPSNASVPSTAPPTSSKATPVPSSTPPTAGRPATATTPSATPASTPLASAPGSASTPASDGPTSEEPGTTLPAAGQPKGKSAGTTLDVGLAVVLTMVLSTFYLTSTI